MIYDVVAANVGYEGLAVDENNFYLGLEGIVNNGNFADSTFIFVVDKQSLIIKKKIFPAHAARAGDIVSFLPRARIN